MLFPEIGPAYLDEKDRSILGMMEAFYAECISINQSYWSEADTDLRFYCGDQTAWNDLYNNLPANRRRQFNFNRIRRVVSMVDGFQRQHRKSMVAIPIENANSQTADEFTKTLIWLDQQEGVLQTVSDAFTGALITGMNLIQVWVDYRSDPVSGNIKLTNRHYNDFIIDPYFKKTDLSDCRGLWTRSYLTKRECLSLLPEHKDWIMEMYGQDNRDGKFQFQAESYNYGLKNLLTYDEFYYRDFRKQKMLVDTETGETFEWKADQPDRLRHFLQTYPQVTVVEQDIPTVKCAIVVQGKVMSNDVLPIGIDTYPFIPVFAYYHPELPYFSYRCQGIVRGLRDSQYLYNRRKVIELDILESQINSGWKYKEDALVNPADVFLSGQGRGLALKQSAQMTDVEQIIAPQIPPSMIELSQILGQEISEISGVNEELLGSAQDDKAGILSMLRQGAGLTTLQGLFDKLDYSQKLLGRLLISIIQANFTPGKMQNILQHKPSDQFYSKAFGKYDIAIEDGINTTTQRQMQMSQLLQLREVGVPIPDELLLEACTLENKKEVIEKITQMQQAQQQAAQQAQQLEMQQAQSQIRLTEATATANEGLGVERLSRVQENQALAEERRAAAIKDEEIGFLNLVRALKEIDGIDIDQMHKLIQISQIMKEHELEKRQLDMQQQNPTQAGGA